MQRMGRVTDLQSRFQFVQFERRFARDRCVGEQYELPVFQIQRMFNLQLKID